MAKVATAKRVHILYTGGTIGMKKVAGSYAPVPGYLGERLAAMPELTREELPAYTLTEYRPLLDSANMSPRVWQRIAADVADTYDAYDGFVIIHGTDTMAYTASALSFMLGGLGKPVILTGSQIPLAEVRSDARENLITSLLLAAHYAVPEVCLYFGGLLLRGNRSTKMSVGGFGAFASPNFPPLGRVGVDVEIDERLLHRSAGPLTVQTFQAAQVAALRPVSGHRRGERAFGRRALASLSARDLRRGQRARRRHRVVGRVACSQRARRGHRQLYPVLVRRRRHERLRDRRRARSRGRRQRLRPHPRGRADETLVPVQLRPERVRGARAGGPKLAR